MKRIAAIVAVAFVAVGAVGGCADKGAGGGATAATTDSVVGTWVLESGHGTEGEITAPADTPIELTIEQGGLYSGTSGCNNISGTLTIEDGAVDMGPIVSTRMACEEDAMATEHAYLTALEAVSAAEIQGESLVLAGDGTELSFKRS